MNKFSRDLVQGMKEAAAFAEGKKGGARVHVVEVPDVRAIRRKLRMSQLEFAHNYRIPLPTLRNWSKVVGSLTHRRRLTSTRSRNARAKSARR